MYIHYGSGSSKDELTQGIHRPDGSTAELSLQDKLICASGFILLQEAAKEKPFKWMADLQSGSCNQGEGCPRGCQRIFYDLFYDYNSVKTCGFQYWREEWEAWLCRFCTKTAKATHEAGRHELWKFLPTAFGLGNWKNLVDFV
jgi:hypothetical protein